MRISELAEKSGVPVATLKFYIREGMLPRGEATSARSAAYTEEHLRRVRLIGALADVRELPLARVRQILGLIDSPLPDPMLTVGMAMKSLPPYAEEAEIYPRAQDTMRWLGWDDSAHIAGMAGLERAIGGILDTGLDWSEERARAYAAGLISIARAELTASPGVAPERMVEYSVLGTAMYEPILLALRRLAHLHVLTTEHGRVAPPLPSAKDELREV